MTALLRRLAVAFLALGAVSGLMLLSARSGLTPSLRHLAEGGLDMAWRVIVLLAFFVVLEPLANKGAHSEGDARRGVHD